VISFLQVVSQIFHEVYNVIYNGIETDKENWRKQYVSVVDGAATSLCCFSAFRRPYVMLSTRRDVHDSEFRPVQQSYFLNRSMRYTHKGFDSCSIDHFYVVFMQSILQSSQRFTSHGSQRLFEPFPCKINFYRSMSTREIDPDSCHY